jgi:amino acid permease
LYLGIQLLPVTITPTGFVVGCVLLFLLAMPTYYYRAQLQAEDMTEHRAAEALAAYASEIKKSR